mmetsp:Transcript_47187/g.98793  ORF Transcript_47187/g.98793 Transcript_47187/m.98793 type:complete len:324 (+) Transcript_47187:316-1287(+)
MDHLSLHAVVVENAKVRRRAGGARVHVETRDDAICLGVLHCDDGIHGVVTSVGSQGLRNHKQRIRIGLHPQLRASWNRQRVRLEVQGERNLEGAGPRNHAVVLDGVLDRAQAIAHGVLDHVDGVLVGALDENRARLRLFAVLDKGVLLLAQRLLVNLAGEAQNIGGEVVDRVLRRPTAGQRKTLHVAPFATAEADDPLLGQHIQGERVDALLVDNDEGFGFVVANVSFQRNHLANLVIDQFSLTLNKPLSVICIGIVKPRRYLGFCVLEIHVQDQDKCVGYTFRHIRMASTMVKHQPPHESGIHFALVLHVHHLDHEEINGHF